MQHHLTNTCLKHKPITSYNYKNVSRRCKYFKVKEEYSAQNEKSHVPKTSSRKQLIEPPKTNLTQDAAQHVHFGLECNLSCHVFDTNRLAVLLKHNSPPQVKRFCRSTRCSGHEHLGVPSPLAMQMCEHPPLSREHGCTAGETYKKNIT